MVTRPSGLTARKLSTAVASGPAGGVLWADTGAPLVRRLNPTIAAPSSRARRDIRSADSINGLPLRRPEAPRARPSRASRNGTDWRRALSGFELRSGVGLHAGEPPRS